MKWMLLLLLASCAANQSAFPVAPPFNPMTDAPITIGHPGYVDSSPKPERSPYKRVLPQTPQTRKEAGIWASDAQVGRPAPTLLSMPVPLPPNGEDQQVDTLAYRCAATMNSAAEDIGIRSVLHAVQKESRQCLSMQLYHYCLFQSTKGKDMDDPTRRKIEAFLKLVRDQTLAACKGVPRPTFEGVYNPVAAEWRRRHVGDDGSFGL